MKNNLLVIFYFLFFFLFLSAQIPEGEIHSGEEMKCSISGILCDGITRMPLSNSYVFALSTDKQEILGYTKTGNIKQTNGFKAGKWRIDNLEPVGDIIIVGFYSETKFNMAIEREFISYLNEDAGYIYTNPPIPIDNPATGFNAGNSPLHLLALTGWIINEITIANAKDEAIVLAERLMEYVSNTYKLIDFNEDDYFPLDVGYSWTYLIHCGNSGVFEPNEKTIKITDRITKRILFNSINQEAVIYIFNENKVSNYLIGYFENMKTNCFVKLQDSIYFGNFFDNVLNVGKCLISSDKPIYISNQIAKIELINQPQKKIEVWVNKYPNPKVKTIKVPYINGNNLELSLTEKDDIPSGYKITFSESIGIIEFRDWYADGNTKYTLIRKNF